MQHSDSICHCLRLGELHGRGPILPQTLASSPALPYVTRCAFQLAAHTSVTHSVPSGRRKHTWQSQEILVGQLWLGLWSWCLRVARSERHKTSEQQGLSTSTNARRDPASSVPARSLPWHQVRRTPWQLQPMEGLALPMLQSEASRECARLFGTNAPPASHFAGPSGSGGPTPRAAAGRRCSLSRSGGRPVYIFI